MKLTTMARIAKDRWLRPPLKETWWELNGLAAELKGLAAPGNEAFRRHVWRDQWRFVTGAVRPVEGETAQRAREAVAWLLRAQGATPDDGVSLGYFPCRGEEGAWVPSYPETTGYIITSLLAYAERYRASAAKAAALGMARWEMAVQMQSGAVQGGPVCEPSRQTPAAFNTGMVLDGWCSAIAASGGDEFTGAARCAADFLANDLDSQGYFRTNGAFVSAGDIKTYTCLCAWALHRFGEISGEARYRETAVRVIEAALRQQQPNGWFAHNCLTRSEAPLTHTMGYTLQGVLEVGLAARRNDFVDAARRGLAPLMGGIDRHGYLPGRFYGDWDPAGFSSCLTGSAQVAIVCYRLHGHTGAQEYRRAGDRLLNFLKALQLRDSPDPALNGAIAGSFPLFGEYMRAGYPNWATKYFLDALMLQDRS